VRGVAEPGRQARAGLQREPAEVEHRGHQKNFR
jgi:hypothetical protein